MNNKKVKSLGHHLWLATWGVVYIYIYIYIYICIDNRVISMY